MTRYLLLFDSCSFVFVERRLWREDASVFCRYCWPLPGAVFLGSILLSPIWDFPFRRLLRLAGSRWRYSTPPPHGFKKKEKKNSNWTMLTLTSSRHGPRTENTTLPLLHACLLEFPRDRYPASPLVRSLLPSTVLLATWLFERVYLAPCCIMVHREHSPYFCVFAATCTLSRCLAMVIFITLLIKLTSLFKMHNKWYLWWHVSRAKISEKQEREIAHATL
jgi:hypothetical protein